MTIKLTSGFQMQDISQIVDTDWRTLARVLAGASVLLLMLAPAHSALAQQEDVVKSGQELFNQKCAVCHGATGKGDGVLAAHLKKQPADLTGLSERNNGKFDFWEVYRKIDGRDVVGAHGPSDMPVWGSDEVHEGTSGRLARAQIVEIVFFLESIQKE